MRPLDGAVGLGDVPVRERILVVDDDDGVRLLIDMILSREGYRCTLAVDALGKENVTAIGMPSQYSSAGMLTTIRSPTFSRVSK